MPLVVGLGRAAQLAAAWLAAGGVESQSSLRDRLETQILQLHPQVRIFGRRAARLPNTVAWAYLGWDGPSVRQGLLRLSLRRETTEEAIAKVVAAFRQALASSSPKPIPEEE